MKPLAGGGQREMAGTVLGIDEAGRGSLLGPLVVACVGVDAAGARRLRGCGVADSKNFGAGERAHAARLALAAHIHQVALYVGISEISPQEIDARPGELNALEREHAARLLAQAPPCERVIADGARLFGPLVALDARVQAVNHGESAHVAVAAASVIAKTRRDALWLAILDSHRPAFGALLQGHCGGGYPNAVVRRFVRAYCEKFQRLPPELRQSWPIDDLRALLPPPPPAEDGLPARAAASPKPTATQAARHAQLALWAPSPPEPAR